MAYELDAHPVTISRFVILMKVLTLAYLLLATIVLFQSSRLLEFANQITSWAGHLALPSNDIGELGVIATTALMISLSGLSYFSSIQPLEPGFTIIHVSTKLLTCGLMFFFFFSHRNFPFLLGGILELILLALIGTFFVPLYVKGG